jgi:isoquinoline 1-oxidoreductase beta subunit
MMLGRREMLKAGAALVVAVHYALPDEATGDFKPNAWLVITADNRIAVFTETPEMGQGTRTAETMALAEELDADLSMIDAQQAPTNPNLYHHLTAGGSGSTTANWTSMRRAGAQAREMLISAASLKWNAEKSDLRTENGTIVHVPTGRRVTYGELVDTASKLTLPKIEDVPLKKANAFRLVGKPTGRVDTCSKVDGSAVFGIDVRVPGMLFAVIARCPHFGGKLASCNDLAAKSVPGVRAVFPVPSIVPRPTESIDRTAGGVAVVAESTWAAIQGRKALHLTWDKGPGANESTASIQKAFRDQASMPPSYVPVNQGDALKEFANAASKIEAAYELPFQAHATMEPMNTTVHIREDGIEVWSPTQGGNVTQAEIAKLAGVALEKVTVHVTLSGGSFGRRLQWDFPAEAWQVAKEVKRPVQLLFTREDDMQHDFYRPYVVHHLSGSLDEHANISAWLHRVSSTAIHAYYGPASKLTDPAYVAGPELGGSTMIPYGPRHFRVEYQPVDSVVPRAWWRSVQMAPNAFATESFIDELAHAVRRDPYEFRMQLLKDDRKISSPGDPSYFNETRKYRAVLELVAEKAQWNQPLPKGRGRGIACYIFGGSYLAQVAEVAVADDGTLRVLRVVSAIDCGLPVNPDSVRAQIEGGINYALTTVLAGEITIKEGAVEQSNFHDYKVLRMRDAPEIEVHIVPGTDEPASGVGEIGVTPLAPAVANAIFAACGKRVRRFPDLKSM